MKEISPAYHNDGIPQESCLAWLPEGIQGALDSDVYEAHDDLYGAGEEHVYGPIGDRSLRFYPDFRTVEYQDLTNYHVITRPVRISVAEEGLVMDAEDSIQSSFFAFNRDGGMVVRVVPKPIPDLDRLRSGESALERPAPAEDTLLTTAPEPITEPPVSEAVAPWEQSTPEADGGPIPHEPSTNGPITETPPARSQKGKSDRMEFTGRIGRLPRFHTTQRGKTVGRFPVAEHSKEEGQDEVTTWYTVAVFNAIAEALKGQIEAGELSQGDEVKIVGYPQLRNVSDGKGGMKEMEEIFAAVVKKPKRKEGK